MACLLLLQPLTAFRKHGDLNVYLPVCIFEHVAWRVCTRACACEPSACSCLGHVWFLSAQRPPPCSQALLQGPKITSLSMLPGLWNNNTPGFPITANPANGDGTENMCGQTGAGGGGGVASGASSWQRWGLLGLDSEQQLHDKHADCFMLLKSHAGLSTADSDVIMKNRIHGTWCTM